MKSGTIQRIASQTARIHLNLVRHPIANLYTHFQITRSLHNGKKHPSSIHKKILFELTPDDVAKEIEAKYHSNIEDSYNVL